MTRKTLLELVETVKSQCDSHEMINSFYYGIADLVNKETDLKPFAVRFAPDTIDYSGNLTSYNMILEVWAEVKPDDSDRLVQESEAESILNDLIISTFRGLIAAGGWTFPVDDKGQFTDFISAASLVHQKEARLTGFGASITFSAFNDLNACLIPEKV